MTGLISNVQAKQHGFLPPVVAGNFHIFLSVCASELRPVLAVGEYIHQTRQLLVLHNVIRFFLAPKVTFPLTPAARQLGRREREREKKVMFMLA